MLTVVQEKLAEAHGLAIAATSVTRKVAERVEDPALRAVLLRMRTEAEETRARCLLVERGWDEDLATEMLQHANATHEKGADLAGAWFKAGTGPLAAWSFLAMGEAGEVATWTALAELAARTSEQALIELVDWALPVQRRHLEDALDGAAQLGRAFEPHEPRWG